MTRPPSVSIAKHVIGFEWLLTDWISRPPASMSHTFMVFPPAVMSTPPPGRISVACTGCPWSTDCTLSPVRQSQSFTVWS
jgi:hypothetical protein